MTSQYRSLRTVFSASVDEKNASKQWKKQAKHKSLGWGRAPNPMDAPVLGEYAGGLKIHAAHITRAGYLRIGFI